MGQVAQVLMELGELRLHVVEAARDRLAVFAFDESQQLFAKEANVLRERMDLLERAVVQVEPQPDEQPLVGRSQSRLAVSRGRPLPLEHVYADSTLSAATRPVR